MNHMLGIQYDTKYKMWMMYDLTFCDCGNHVCKSLLKGDSGKNVIKAVSDMITKYEKGEKHEKKKNNP